MDTTERLNNTTNSLLELNVQQVCSIDKNTLKSQLSAISYKKQPKGDVILGHGEKGALVHCWWEYKFVSHCGKQYGGFPLK